ncbi:Hypothetical predicted protein [Paramuricea clavata]|uniref:DNA 3'-5' helicase n=1 Tax=Paramuricea clavata TaxID=317549 RepID=A0A6S7FGZ2_PARCT|nr:Hypothetical predicted protein [Paramuricea clavata]
MDSLKILVKIDKSSYAAIFIILLGEQARKAAFRQAFGNVKDLRSFVGSKPMLALSATADKSMRQQLCKLLGFKGHKELVISPNKENIRFSVMECDKTFNCFNWLVDMLKEKKADAPHTIIFCHTVNDIVLVLSTLFMKLGNDAYLEGTDPVSDRCILAVYYSATPDSEKNSHQLVYCEW